MTVAGSTPTHDQLGRLALEYLAGAPACGLPSGAAFVAFTRVKSISPETAEILRAVLRVVKAA